MRYLKIDEQNWHDLFEGYLYGIGTWKTNEEKAEFYKKLFENVIKMIEESNGEWQ